MSSVPMMTALLPRPPKWNEHYDDAVASLANYKLFPVDANTAEYATISNLLYPATVSTVEQVVNPILWSRFVNARKDLLKLKSENFQLVSQLGVSDVELKTCHDYLLKFMDKKDSKVASVPYNDHMALLFHCTGDTKKLDAILAQGLDERLGNLGGLLGRGIYFTDDPQKSFTYDGTGFIFIFGVLLGDCLSIAGKPRLSWVREPRKEDEQKRNISDSSFDSICAQPMNANEFVIYNRYQCVPLYKVKYSNGKNVSAGNPDSDVYLSSRKKLSPFGWKSTNSDSKNASPNARVTESWPFYADTLFKTMKANEEVKYVATINNKKEVATLPEIFKYFSRWELNDEQRNVEVLKKFDFDVCKSLHYLFFVLCHCCIMCLILSYCNMDL